MKIAFRNFWKNRGYSLLNIFGLAIGITCAGPIFLWVENEMSSSPRPMAAAMGIALVTISFQSVKAPLMNPVRSLRA